MECAYCGKYIVDDTAVVIAKEMSIDTFGFDKATNTEFCSTDCAAKHFANRDISQLRHRLNQFNLDIACSKNTFSANGHYGQMIKDFVDDVESRIAEYRQFIQKYIEISDEAMELKEKGA